MTARNTGESKKPAKTEAPTTDAVVLDANRRLESILEAAHVGTWEWNVQTGETVLNEVWAEMVGYTLEELAPISITTWETLAHPDDLKRSGELLERHFDGKLPYYDCESRMKHKDGHWVWVHDRGRVITRTDDGKPLMMVGTHTDITERKRAAEALRGSEEQHRTILQTAMDGFWLLDTQGRLLEVNETYCRMTGYSAQELLAMSIPDLDATLSAEEIASRLEEIMVRGEARFETRHRRKDGSIIDIENSVQYQPEQGGRIVVFLRDISERKRVDEALAHSRDLMRYVIEYSRSAVAVHDRDLKYLYVSQRYLDEYGVKEKDVIGKHHYDVFPDLPQKWRDVHQKALAGEISSEEDDAYARDDGTVDWTRWECRPWHEADGSIGGIIVYTEVITERKRVEEALRKSQIRLAEAMDLAHMTEWEFDALTGTFTFNDRFYALYGTTAEREGGYQMSAEVYAREFVYPDDQHLVAVEVERALNATDPAFISEVEHRIVRRDGEVRHIVVRHSVIMDADGKVVGTHGANQDNTERKRAEEALTESRDLLANLARLVPGVIYQYRLWPDGRSAFPYASTGMWDIYEVTPEEVREDATPVFGRLHPDDFDLVSEAIQESARTLNPFHCDFRVILPEQGLRWRWSQAHPERTADGGTLWHGIISDNTRRKEAEKELLESREQLRALAQRLEEIREEEKSSLARDLHDDLGQTITGLRMDLGALRDEFPEEGRGTRARLTEMVGTTDHMLDEVRSICARLRPPILDVLGLQEAIIWQVEEVEKRSGLAFELNLDIEGAILEGRTTTAAFRLIQESLTNVMRHANATRVRISLQREGGFLVGEVQDDGRGISSEAVASGTSLGLLGMQERVRSLDGEHSVEPMAEGGTLVRFRLPFQKDPRLGHKE